MITTAEWIQKACYYHGDRYNYSEIIYCGAGKRVKIICRIHGPWWVTASQHASPSAHHGCKRCGKVLSDNQWLRRFREEHGDEYDYSRCVFQGSKTPVEIICKEHGSFDVTPLVHGRGQSNGSCPDCRRLESRERFLERAKAAHGDRYNYSLMNFMTIHNKVEIICTEHGSFWQTPHNHELGHGCGKCGGHGRPQHR